jgi:hypothetical protein
MSPECENNLLGPPSSAKLADYSSDDFDSECESIDESVTHDSDVLVFFINEATLGQSPQVEIMIDNVAIHAILDSGSEVNLLSERAYQKLTQSGIDVPILPVEHVVLITAFGRRSKRIRNQALIEFTVGEDSFESVFMISSQLNNDAIIGCQFLKEYGIVIDFHKGSFSYVRGTQLREHLFSSKDGPRYGRSKDQSETENLSLLDHTSRVQGPPPLPVCESNFPRTVNSCSYPTPHHTVEAGSLRESNKYQGEGVRVVPLSAETQGRSRGGEVSVDNGSLNHGTEGDRLLRKFLSKSSCTPSSPRGGFACFNTTRGLNANCSRRNLPHSDPIPIPKSDFSDPRSLRKTDLFSLVEQVGLNGVQKRQLYEVLAKYISHMTTKPGRCNLFSYQFQVNTDKPIVGYSRPIPFATRPAVREQINQMMKDGILEISTSPPF